METMTLEDRFNRLDSFVREDRIVRGRWADERDGRERACLLAAIAPECAKSSSALACPASVLPRWWARLTPRIDDRVALSEWPDIVREYARVTRRAAFTVSPERWDGLDYACRAIAVREVLARAPTGGHVAAAEAVAALCDRAARGGKVASKEWFAARDAARAAYAADASHAAAAASHAAAVDAAYAAASHAARAARAAYADAVDGAADAAWSRMARAWLAAIDAACEEAA